MRRRSARRTGRDLRRPRRDGDQAVRVRDLGVDPEGHTAHETEQAAIAETLTIPHDVYAETIEEVLMVIVPITREADQAEVLAAAAALRDELAASDLRVRFDDRPERRPGFKFNDWELKGLPVRVEFGGPDLASGSLTVARRDTALKEHVPHGVATGRIERLLTEIQAGLFQSELARARSANPLRSGQLCGAGRLPPGWPWVRSGFLVRKRGLRSASQGGCVGDDSVPPARRAIADWGLRVLRSVRGGVGGSGCRRTDEEARSTSLAVVSGHREMLNRV